MPNLKPLTNDKGEVREIKADDLAGFGRGKKVLPANLQKTLGVRGPQKLPIKEKVTIRLSPDVVKRFRDSGDGWQSRVDGALRDWLKAHRPR
jgi:uncharacterized protein (DUF4415 family)